MKGLIIKILTVVCIACLTIGVLGCSNPEHEHVYGEWASSGTTHVRRCTVRGCEEFEQHDYLAWEDEGKTHIRRCSVSGCEEFEQHDYSLFIDVGERQVRNCETLGCAKYDSGIITANSEFSIKTALSSAQNGQIIRLKNNGVPYRSIEINNNVDNLIITAEEGTTVQDLQINMSTRNLILHNIDFVGEDDYDGLEWMLTQYNLTLYECSFTGTAVIASNLTQMRAEGLNIIECEFIDIESPRMELPDNGLTAILIWSLKDLVIKDSTFDGVQYNVIQVGRHSYSGSVTITGNTFKNIGSRVLYFTGDNTITTCDISGNKFYDNTDCPKAGVYLKTNDIGIVVGKNYWENIPEYDKFYFNYNDLDSPVGGITYDKSQQELIQP